MLWGNESAVTDRFVAAGVPAENIAFARDTFLFEHAGPPTELVNMFRDFYGPTMNAFAAAAANNRSSDLQKDLETLFEAQNTSETGDKTSIPATFLRVTVDIA